MYQVKHASISSIIFDLRTIQQKIDAKYNYQTSTLNHKTLDVFIHRPSFVHQQQRINRFFAQIFVLELQNIILRYNSLNENSMMLSLLGVSIPYPLPYAFELNDDCLIPATYSKVTTQQDEQSFLIATKDHLIRITEQYDGWRVCSKKGRPNSYGTVLSCCILTDDKVLVFMSQSYSFYTSSLDLINVIQL